MRVRVGARERLLTMGEGGKICTVQVKLVGYRTPQCGGHTVVGRALYRASGSGR